MNRKSIPAFTQISMALILALTLSSCQKNKSSQGGPYFGGGGGGGGGGSGGGAPRTPTLSHFYPTHGSIFGGTYVYLSGSDFSSSGNKVTIGGVNCKISYEYSFYISCKVESSSSARIGQSTLTVKTAEGVEVTSSDHFTFQMESPSISSFTPDRGPVSGGTSITIHGSRFAPTSTVTLSNLPCAVTARSVNSLTCLTGRAIYPDRLTTLRVSNGVGFETFAPGYFNYEAVVPAPPLPPPPPRPLERAVRHDVELNAELEAALLPRLNIGINHLHADPERAVLPPQRGAVAPIEIRSCPGRDPRLTAEQKRGLRANKEDVDSLLRASCSDLHEKLAENIQNAGFGFNESLTKAFNQAYQSFRNDDLNSIVYNGVHYHTHVDFLTTADPYLFIEREAHGIDEAPVVRTAELNELQKILIATVRANHNPNPDRILLDGNAVGEALRRRIAVLKLNLRHMKPEAGILISERQIRFRKRLRQLIQYAQLSDPDQRLGLLLNLALHLEGDNVRHCADGLENQLNVAENMLLGVDSEPTSLGDHISRTLRKYKQEFISQHRLLYPEGSEARIYVPMGLTRMMIFSLGLDAELTPLQHPDFFRHEHNSADQVMKRLLTGEAPNGHRFEALTPQKMIQLLDLTARRGLGIRIPDADRRDPNDGVKIAFQFITNQFEGDNQPFKQHNPAFAARLHEDYEKYAMAPANNNPHDPEASKFFKTTDGGQTLPTEAFWKEMLIHYKYIVQ